MSDAQKAIEYAHQNRERFSRELTEFIRIESISTDDEYKPHVLKAAEWAAERATDADLVRLKQAFAAMNDAFDADDLNRCSSTDIAFHQAIGEASHNVLIGQITAALLRLMHDHIHVNLGELKNIPTAISLLKNQHAAIFTAICEAKPALARTAAQAHIDYVRASLAESLRSAVRRETAARRLSSEFAES